MIRLLLDAGAEVVFNPDDSILALTNNRLARPTGLTWTYSYDSFGRFGRVLREYRRK